MDRPASPRGRRVAVAAPTASIVRRCVSGLAALRLWRGPPAGGVEMCAGAGSYRALYAPEEDTDDLTDGAMISVEGGGDGGAGGDDDADDSMSSVSSESSAGVADSGRSPAKPCPTTERGTNPSRRGRSRLSSATDTRAADEPLIRTRGVTCNPPEASDGAPSYVRRGDAFVVRVLGVMATPHDWRISRKNNRIAGSNELVVWSERGDAARRRHRAVRRNARVAAGMAVAASPAPASEAAAAAVATSRSGADAAGVSTIHFDFAERGGYASRPGGFVPVPASRSVAVRELGCGPPLRLAGWASPQDLAAAAAGGAGASVPWVADVETDPDDDDAPASINLRISVAEVDNSSSLLSSIHSFVSSSNRVSTKLSSSGAGYIAEAVGSAEVADGLVGAANGAGRLAQLALERAARTDMVLSVDQDFRLLPRVAAPSLRMAESPPASRRSSPSVDDPEEGSAEREWQASRFVPPPPGRSEYLRYGTYFFLSRAVPERLYARLDDRLNVALCTRTPPPVAPDGRRGLATYAPIRGVSYVVVRVERLDKLEAAIAEIRSPSPRSESPMSRQWQRVEADRNRIASLPR